jgi:hypothetical protein
VTAVNSAPTVATAAAVSPNLATGSTASLSVLGPDDGDEANLIYTWATLGTPPAAVMFSANGTNAAKNTTATFSKAGSYSFLVTIKDQANLTVTSAVSVTVSQTLTVINVTPVSASVGAGGAQQYTATAVDQFGNALSTQPTFTWNVSGGGTISTTGLFTAGTTTGGPYAVTASSGALSGSASVTVIASTPINIGTTTVLSSTLINKGGVLLAYKVSLAQTATIQSISVYAKRTGGYLRVAIYSDNAGYPGTLQAATAEFAPVAGWNIRTVTSQIALSAGTYWLVCEPSSNSFGIGYDFAGSSKSSYTKAITYGPMPSAYPTGGSASSYRFSMYATLVP